MKAIVLHLTRYRLEAANDSIGGPPPRPHPRPRTPQPRLRNHWAWTVLACPSSSSLSWR
jgi:hypothetical protein